MMLNIVSINLSAIARDIPTFSSNFSLDAFFKTGYVGSGHQSMAYSYTRFRSAAPDVNICVKAYLEVKNPIRELDLLRKQCKVRNSNFILYPVGFGYIDQNGRADLSLPRVDAFGCANGSRTFLAFRKFVCFVI